MTIYEQDLQDQHHTEAIWNSLNQPLHYAGKYVGVRGPNRAFGRCAVRVQRPHTPIAADRALHAVEDQGS